MSPQDKVWLSVNCQVISEAVKSTSYLNKQFSDSFNNKKKRLVNMAVIHCANVAFIKFLINLVHVSGMSADRQQTLLLFYIPYHISVDTSQSC